MIVTIDGPAGAGKSSAARQLAARLDFQFLDTGAMYRAVTWYCLDRRIDLEDEQAVADAARRMRLSLTGDRVLVDGREVSREIRSAAVTQDTRHVAGNNAVRRYLVDLQREIADGRNVVTEGRDQGTVAFPHAECKFFLIADPRQRALRRQRDYAARGEHVSLEEILAHQTSRDERDALREYGALKAAADAITVDTSEDDLAGVVARLEELVRTRIRHRTEAG